MTPAGPPVGTVLLVDDSEELLGGLSTLLRNAGHTVLTLTSGAKVAETVALGSPDVVVLDVMMPVVDGWEALRRLRENPACARVAVMMLTAQGGEDAKVRGFELGADDYLAKPFGIREFKCRVDALMRRTRGKDEAIGESIPVIAPGGGTRYLDAAEVCYAEGVRNFVYLHTYDARFLGRLSLGALERRALPDFKRVHRSYLVRRGAVRGCGWLSHSSFKLTLADAGRTTIPVSRVLVAEVRAWLESRDG